ncbi:MAG: RagB/SusD family nutrient uptake outer membrane protein [Paramuribaculum sp.]|nr:RagB/SusD family nutrient uptake outer membrane protein [Paramuribaculum sp.]
MRKINILLSVVTGLAMTSCYDLNREPEDVLSSAVPFKTTDEMHSYLNQFYESAPVAQGFMAGGGGGMAGAEVNSDNLSSPSVDQRLAGRTSIASASSLGNYTNIRNVNFLLANLDNCQNKETAAYNQYVGEAYFFRALYYYRMFVNYGPLAWVDTPLDPDLEAMKLPRENRTVIADHILNDLDMAAQNLQTQNNSASMRIHRDVALALKSEVALFEGTWEKNHKAKNTPFYDPTITDDKINSYLSQAAAAAKEVMDRNVWRIYSTGNPLTDYGYIFQQDNLSNNSEILWYKRYDGDLVGNSVTRYLNEGGGGVGPTASLIDDYLTIDGRPYLGDEKLQGKITWGVELSPEVRDPRLCQTIATTGQQLRRDQAPYNLPPLTGNSAWAYTTSGYSMIKHLQTNYAGNLDAEYKGSTPAIQFRYADVLLNYAEALAELNGAANAQAIIDAIHPLRARVGMPDMDFDREYNTDPEYPFANLDKYVQAVRRERRVEKVFENTRLTDILRWAAADVLIVGKFHRGILFVGSNLENMPQYANVTEQYALTGNPGDKYRYIIPTNPAGYESGWQFRLNQDYLLPIQERMISLTDGLWYQNPGW